MLQTEYVRNINSNYERILLEKKPEENRYQYCILSRGGIKGLLACSLRYINGQAYLYYDISSKQNVAQLFAGRCLTREWVKDFFWSMRQIQQELGRFLLDDRNILWNPDQIFQDLESNIFSFLYVPYYEGENSFGKLLEFWVEHIDYDDEVLVDCVYHMYEQLERNGEVYLQTQVFEDAKMLDKQNTRKEAEPAPNIQEDKVADSDETAATVFQERDVEILPDQEDKREEKKGILGIFENKRKKSKELRENYRQEMQKAMNGYAVAEENFYEPEEYGQTVYIEVKTEESEQIRRLFTPEDKLIASIQKPILSIGKKKEEVDVVLEDSSVSRMHARITKEGKDYYLEDLNSTNGTWKNGLRLQPYEKRKLECGDEIKCGRVMLIFR